MRFRHAENGRYCALATQEIMENISGFQEIAKLGQHTVRTFNDAAGKAGVAKLIKAETVFGGAMFDIHFASSILSDTRRRQLLPRCLIERQILPLQGHPSFICLDHKHIDWELLQQQLSSGLSKWACLTR